MIPRIALLAAGALALAVAQGCLSLAGGSSEVDNPQVKVAFVDESGAPVAFTGSIALYLADQNPALDPDPLIEVQLSDDSVAYLSAAHLIRAGSPRFNLLARSAAGTSGALLDSIAYDSAGRVLRVKSAAATRLHLSLAPTLRCSASVSLDVNGAERVFVPGTPYQAVVVSDSFAFSNIPAGVFPLRVYSSGGVEREFSQRLDTRDPAHFALDTAEAPPIQRPPPAEEPSFGVNAGTDQSAFTNTDVFLAGTVSGVSEQDKRVGALWRQVRSSPQDPWAYIEHASSLKTRVRFSAPGLYQFVLSASYRTQKAEDTVAIGVQAGQLQLWEPGSNSQYFIGYPAAVKWIGFEKDTLDLEFSPDSGATWQVLLENTVSNNGYNERYWFPEGPATTNAFIRLRDPEGKILATSPRFNVSTWTGGFPTGYGGYGGYDDRDH